jgi:hypothetical protein
MQSVARGAAVAVAFGAISGCGGEAPAVTQRSGTFYQFDDFGPGGLGNRFEVPHPSLDQPAHGDRPAYMGVDVLGQTVRFARPKGWTIRRASLTPERRYIEYVSPSQYVFAIYERTDSPSESWGTVLGRYEADAKEVGAELVTKRVPVAAAYASGREYVVHRKVRGAKGPYLSTSREMIFRNEHRIVLVSLVHQGDTPALVADELRPVYESLMLL